MKLKIEYLPISEIKTYPNNAKIHTAEQINGIKRSIQDFGFNDPIAIWGNGEVIEGHGRIIAATELGMDKVPVIRLDELTDQQRKAYMLVHNKLTMDTDFNMDILQIELSSLDSMQMEDFGFTILMDDPDPEDFEDKEDPEEETEPYIPKEYTDDEFGVLVMCADEADMVKTYKELSKLGYNCKPY